jgi:hypothetical protein
MSRDSCCAGVLENTNLVRASGIDICPQNADVWFE